MRDERDPRDHREVSLTASESCYLCSARIWPGDAVARFEGLPVHGGCFDRDIRPDLDPNPRA